MFVLSKKEKSNPLLMEVRRLLLNQVDVEKDGRLVAVDEVRTFRYGAAEGEHKVRISGITTRDYFYRTKYNHTKAVYQSSDAMKDIGRRVNLQCMDGAAACVIKSPVFYPVVLVFYENGDGHLQLSAFTAKAFLALFAINSALKKFDKELPDAMERKVSIHSIHDINRAILHNLQKLAGKENETDDGNYVNLKNLFKPGRKQGKDSSGQSRGVAQKVKLKVTDQKEPEERETSQEKKARRKAQKLEKKREAARRKYEKLMGEELDRTSVREEYTEEEEDIMLALTGMSSDEFSGMEEAADEVEDDEDIMRELTGMGYEDTMN